MFQIARELSGSQWRLFALRLALSLAPATSSFAQDARELEQERTANQKLKGEHPLIELMGSRESSLRAELVGVHPRVYVTDKQIEELGLREHTEAKA